MVAGWMWIPVLRFLAGNPHGYPKTLAALILLYVVVDGLGGSAAMAILAFAVMVGNAEPIMRRLGFTFGEGPLEIDLTVRTAHSQISFIVKSFFFTFIGLMLSPPWAYLALGMLFGVVLLIARVPMVRLATIGAGFTKQQMKMVTVAMPRGMAAGVLATIPAYRGVPGTEILPPVVFAAVLTSILIFAVGLPMIRNNAAAATPTSGPEPAAQSPGVEPAPQVEPAPPPADQGGPGVPAAAPQPPAVAPPPDAHRTGAPPPDELAAAPAPTLPIRTGDTGRFAVVAPPHYREPDR
jgi:cell volume regulation protein A